MKLTRFSKQIIAVVCSIALVIAGFAFAPSKDTTADVDPSTLDYTMVESGGKTIGYNVVSHSITGWGNPWYGDGGVTFQLIFAGGDVNPADQTTVKVNGVETSSGIVSLIGAGLVKLNPTQMDDNAYTHVEITAKTGSAEIYFKKGNPPSPESSSQDPSVPTSSVEPTSTTELPVPGVTVGFEAKFLQNDTILYVAHGPASGTVTGYHYYLDGVLDSRFFNGVNLPVTDFTAGQTYTIEVRAYNASGEGPGSTATFTIPNPEPENYMDVTPYKATTPYTYPTKEGKIFAGWFSDAEFTTPYMETTGKAYAKFIDEKVLSVKFQKKNDNTAVRFVSTIDDCVDYQSAGFDFTGNYGNKAINKSKTITKVYRTIIAGGETKTPSTEFNNDDSAYFFTFTVRGMDGTTESDWTVTPFFVTPDGTRVTGTTGTYDM